MLNIELKEILIKKWAHAPWHSWMKTSPQWLDLFAELWARLPIKAFRTLHFTTRTLIILPPVEVGRVVKIQAPLLRGAHLLQLNATLLERPRAQILGILAHEFAHLCVPASDDIDQNDLNADALVREWGFSKELDEALKWDLPNDHRRINVSKLSA